MVGGRVRENITGPFGIPYGYENGRIAVDFCAKVGLCMGNAN